MVIDWQRVDGAMIVRGDGLDELARCVLARIQQLQRRERMSVARQSQLYALVLAARMFANEHQCSDYLRQQ